MEKQRGKLGERLRGLLLVLCCASVVLHALSWWQLARSPAVERDVLLGLLAGPIVCLSGQAAYRGAPERPALARICSVALALNFLSLLVLLVTGRLAPLLAILGN
ncbi:MAG: hypothetical protein AAB011_03800 [Candidatus Eisenbacteria bacterium]